MAYVMGADAHAFFAGDALVALGCNLDFFRQPPNLKTHGTDIPFEVDQAGLYVSNFADFVLHIQRWAQRSLLRVRPLEERRPS